MINRSVAFLVAALGALVLGLASSSTVGELVGVDVARAQSPAPSAGTAADPGVDDTTAAADPAPDAQLDDTATGTPDEGGLGRPLDDQPGTGSDSDTSTATGTGSAPAPPPDPEAGLGDPSVECLDQGGDGAPIDDTGTAGVTAADPGPCAASGTGPGTGSTTDPDAGLDDTPVGGLDNTDLGATQTPGLTSIRTPIVEIGRAAALQLFARLEGEPAELSQLLPFELVQRGSTAAPAASTRPGAVKAHAARGAPVASVPRSRTVT